MRTLQQIAEKHYSGYLVNFNNVNNNTSFSFCNGKLKDVRSNNVIIATINAVMDSAHYNDYVICDKYGNSLEVLRDNDAEYRVRLGYTPPTKA